MSEYEIKEAEFIDHLLLVCILAANIDGPWWRVGGITLACYVLVRLLAIAANEIVERWY